MISLHALDLTFKLDNANKPLVYVSSSEGKKQQCTDMKTLADFQQVAFSFESELAPGNYHLTLQYTGIHNDQLAGFYRSKYTAKDGTVKYMVTTQFEACDCRRALPCWDEPNIKAIFIVTLVVEPGLLAISNMPVCRRATTLAQDGTGDETGLVYAADLVKYEYLPSPIMSTYLLAFVIGEFDYLEAVGDNNVAIRVYTPVGKTAQGGFALDCATRCLKFFNEWFGLPYPLPKVDLLAIPDFAGWFKAPF